MSQQEQLELEDEEVQQIFLNPQEETSGENAPMENRPSAPEPFEMTRTQSSTDSGEMDAEVTDILTPPVLGPANSDCVLELVITASSESERVPLSEGPSIHEESENASMVSVQASTSGTESILIHGIDIVSGPSQEHIGQHLQPDEEVSGGFLDGQNNDISTIIERRCLCRSCIDSLLHSGYTISYFIKKFADNCNLCEFKTNMKDYQKICKECSRRKNLCMKCTEKSVFCTAESVFNFEALLDGEEGQIFATFSEEIQHRIIKKVFRAFDIPATKVDSENYARRCFTYLIEKYKARK